MAAPSHYDFDGRAPWIPVGGYVLKARAERLEFWDKDLNVYGSCSEQVPALPDAWRRKSLLCFVSCKSGFITHLARCEARYPSSSGFHKLDLWQLVSLAAPTSIAKLVRKLPAKGAKRAKEAFGKGGHLPRNAYQQVLAALAAQDAEANNQLQSLVDPTGRPLPAERSNAHLVWAYQRDAAVTALEIANIPKEQLRVPPQLESDTATDYKSIFVDSEVRALEDWVVLNDLDGEPDWERLKKFTYPARTFRAGETELTVLLANKERLEVLLGVDLIYVNKTLRSAVFVQYKMLDEAGRYRPDKQLDKEVVRMNAAAKKLGKAAKDVSCDGYRLSSDPFFFKFCSRILEHEQVGHVQGSYIPLSLWKRLIADPRTKGTRGGRRVLPSHLRRHLSHTHFKDFVRMGLIGTTSEATQIVVAALRDAMAGKRGLVLAIENKVPVEDFDMPTG